MGLTLAQAVARTGQLYEELARRRKDVDRFNRYFRGEQPLAYASPEWRQFHSGRFGDFSDNWCGVVANSPSERLRRDGFRIGAHGELLTADELQLQRDWDINDLDAQSSQGFLQSIIAKRSNVLVWGDSNNEPVVTWESPTQTVVGYEAGTQRRTASLKAWADDKLEFATLYLADEVWKLQRTRLAGDVRNGQTSSGLYVAGVSAGAGTVIGSGGWQRRENLPDVEPWPLPNPLGVVPMVEFPNRPMLGGEPLSDIAGTVAMQDAVNLLWAYLFGAADFASMPARVIMGQEPPKVPILDAQGQKIGERAVSNDELKRGRLLWLNGQNTSIGQFSPANLEVFTGAINICVRHVAAQTRTPVHYIVGELSNVNGETLLAGETGLVKKVEEAQLFYTGAVREVHRLTALVRGNKDLAEACRLGRVQWKDAQTRTTAQAADAAVKDVAVGMPLAWIARERYGLNQAETEELLRMRQAERDADDAALERVARPLRDPTDPDAGAA